MVTELVASKEFKWKPDIYDAKLFMPGYVVSTEARITPVMFNSKFIDLPSCGMWTDRKESDEELLQQIGGNWSSLGDE